VIEPASVLFTGGSGLLGSEFRRLLPGLRYPALEEFDVIDPAGMETYLAGAEVRAVVHAAAFTSPPKVDQDPLLGLEVNVVGTCNVVRLCARHGLRLIYLSTDYVFDGERGGYREEDPVHPVNKYAWSKLGGECAVRMLDDAVIIRTSFGPNEFPYDKAFVDQWTSREPVRIVAAMIARVLDSDVRGVLHVGGDRKSVYEYATRVSPEKTIGKLTRAQVPFRVPADTSLDVTRYRTYFP
jgi:dTDP-4-dehydrorhamnose reductase